MMTREENICQSCAHSKVCKSNDGESSEYCNQHLALTAIRPFSREQVEKVWRGEWKCHGDCGVTECSACGWNIEEYVGDYNFCPACGAAQTDEAVKMVMKREEALHDKDV